jgi:mannosyltransferase
MEVEIIITNLKKRYTGVSGTINALLPEQAKTLKIGFVGAELPGSKRAAEETPENFSHFSLWQAIIASHKTLPDGRKRIWHVRRDHEMLLAIILRDWLRFPIKIVFTSAAQRLHSWFPRWLISRMDAVIATTPEAAAFVNATLVIPHGVDVEYFKPPLDKLNSWQRTGLPGKYGVGTFGRIRPEKGTDIFVDAMVQVLPDFPEFTAVIAGLCQPEFEKFKKTLEGRIADHGLLHRIIFVGEVPADEIRNWYGNVLITVACPRYEGYGLTLLEGMACGCAVVASDTGIFKKVVDASGAGHIGPTGDSRSIAKGLRQLMKAPEESCRIGNLGREYIFNELSLVQEANQIRSAYNKLWTTTKLTFFKPAE